MLNSYTNMAATTPHKSIDENTAHALFSIGRIFLGIHT
jgi:hypothetical protein